MAPQPCNTDSGLAEARVSEKEPTQLTEAERKLLMRIGAVEFLLIELFAHLAVSAEPDAPRKFALSQAGRIKKSFERVAIPGALPSEADAWSDEIGEAVQNVMAALLKRLPKDKPSKS